MPLSGVIFYFAKTPRFFSLDFIKAKLISVFILTIVLPILLYILLKTIGKVKSIHLATTRQRVIPLMFNTIIILLVIRKVIPYNQSLELYYFFVGILLSNLVCLSLALLKFKASIHMIGVSGLAMFFITLSIHYSINIDNSLAIIAIIIGAVATSRLHLQAHNTKELIVGCFIGFIPQLILVRYWL